MSKPVSRRRGSLVFVLLLLGCDAGPSEELTYLREYLGGSIELRPSSELGMPRRLAVKLVRPQPVGVLDCDPLPAGTEASINGARMTMESRGDYNFGSFQYCEDPSFIQTALVSGSLASGTLKIDDGRTKLEVVIPHLFEQREFRLAAPADGVLRPGDQVVIEHSPPSDTLAPGYAGDPGITIRARPYGTQVAELPRVIDGATVRFQAPPPTGSRGGTPAAVWIDFSLEVLPLVDHFEASAEGRPKITLGIGGGSLAATLLEP
jgi:hypothetical protein